MSLPKIPKNRHKSYKRHTSYVLLRIIFRLLSLRAGASLCLRLPLGSHSRPSGQFLKTAAEQANNWELVRWQASFTNERADDANTEALHCPRNSGAQGHKSFVIDCLILPSVPPPSNAIQSRSASFFLILTFQTKLRDKGDLTSETTSIFSGRS